MTTISDNGIIGLDKRKEEIKMKITKKLAKEMFMGDFSNVNFEELTKDNKGRVNRFENLEEIERLYKETLDLPLLKKDFEGLRIMEIIKVPNEDYKHSKGHLKTDVLCLNKTLKGYYLTIHRENSRSYYKHVTIVFNYETKNKIINRMIDKLNTDF